MTKVQSKIKIVYSMRKWSFKYIAWRLTTAYPGGWRYAVRHPIELVKDMYKYLAWCQEIDRYVRK
tara:strand:- start:1321 stop:1515 length:195 start_codon:yes stop_codon:yes gene_type:complete